MSGVASQRWARRAALVLAEELGEKRAAYILERIRQVDGADKTTAKTLDRILREVAALQAGREAVRPVGRA